MSPILLNKIFIITGLMLLLLFTILTSCVRKKQPEKTAAGNDIIPQNAFFIKGKHSGYWCVAKVHSHKNNAFITLYDAETGDIVISKRFMVICLIKDNPLWIEDLEKQIVYFDGEYFHLQRLEGQDSCWLQ